MNTQLKIVQIGCGVVGGAYLEAFTERGLRITGIDVNKNIIDKYNKMDIECYHKDYLPDGLKANLILISVPTPLKKDSSELNLDYVFSTLETVKDILTEDSIILIRSTVKPGTTKLYKEHLIELVGHSDFHIGFNPEFLRAKSCKFDALNPWLVIIGIEDNQFVKDTLKEVYENFLSKNKIKFIGIEEGEFLKIVHNFSNALKISYGNCVYHIGNNLNMNIDVLKVLNLVSITAESSFNPQYGIRFLGLPYGGTCLPKDVPEMRSIAQTEITKNFINSVYQVNELTRMEDNPSGERSDEPLVHPEQKLFELKIN